MAIRDDVDVGVLGVLRGGTLNPGVAKHHALAGVILGTGIGAHVDAGFSDEEILVRCRMILAEIRQYTNADDPLVALADRIRGG